MLNNSNFRCFIALTMMLVFNTSISSQEDNEPTATPEAVEILIRPSSDLDTIQQTLLIESGCKLPCFLGLIPGVTSSRDVLELAPLDYEPDDPTNYDSRFVNLSIGEDDLELFVMDLTIENEILSQLTIAIRNAHEWLPENTIDLPSLLAAQIDAQPEIFIHINLTLFRASVYVYYSEPEMLFQYILQLDVVGDVFDGDGIDPLLLCTSLDAHEFVRLRLRSQEIDYEDTLIELYLSRLEDLELLWDIERMTGLDVQTFQTQIVENPNACFELPSIAELNDSGH